MRRNGSDSTYQELGPRRGAGCIQGYLAHKKTPTPLGPPQDPRHRPTVGSYGVAVSYTRGSPVTCAYWLFRERYPKPYTTTPKHATLKYEGFVT